MPLNELLRAGHAFEINYNQYYSKWGSNKTYHKLHTYWTELRNGFEKFQDLYLLRRAHGALLIDSSDLPPLKPSLQQASSSDPNPALSLSSIMRTSITKHNATVPRDLVYGILGFVDGDISIEADYTASIAEAFAQATARILQEELSLQILTLHDISRYTEHDLPSWVLD